MAERIGQQLGNYRLTSLLGRGGFAEVYLGEHIYLKTQAAVKVLQTRLSDSEDMESFLQEAQTVAHLSHHNIVRTLDFGVDNETPFLVIDYAPNGSLRQRHKRGERLPLETVIRYSRQIADALQYAHDVKLIHRDIKPENILVGRNNEILLSDFGIALIAQSSRYQSTQDVVGTVAYMSPEQIQGHPRPASDQYSLGIVVYEWLCGGRPFNGSFTELCTQHMFASVPPLSTKVPAISLEVEQVVTTALAKEPKQRFGSVRAFATALEQAGRPVARSTRGASSTRPPLASRTRPDHSSREWSALADVPGESSVHLSSLSPLPSVSQGALLEPDASTLSAKLSARRQRPEVNAGDSEEYVKKRRIWSIGMPQLLAALIGSLVYGFLQYMLNTSALVHPANGVQLTNMLLLLPSPYSVTFIWGILFSSALFIPFLIGAKFGPWSGLVTAALGMLAANWLSGMFISTLWSGYLVWGIFFGFIPGFILVRTKGYYALSSAISPIIVISLLSLLLGGGIISAFEDIHFLLYFLPGFLLIPTFLVIALFGFGKIAQHVISLKRR